ncbi:DNA cytosine methyltransferase [Nostoc sp. GT001]|uniref:DNA cytosine methyltransferase n=1 Tax=Nostoc sp. GT001 TaxID=3056647 RepID=UPI0025AB3CAD|nr:DNA cytosine methyltransferase [Nostoc sp. GT001]MDM9583078.1 DNA cytosine methyltransferase [Nostoc sp. GT001]
MEKRILSQSGLVKDLYIYWAAVPKKQALLYPQMNVISLDANYAMNLASNYCKAVWTDGKKNIEHQEQGCYQALSLSLKEQFQFWATQCPVNATKSEQLMDEVNTQQFKIGDRVKWRDVPESIYQIAKPERGGHVTIELIESSTKPKPPRRKRVTLWEIQLLAKRPSSGTDLGFKVGDRIISKHRLSLGQTFEIAEYPNVYADGLVSYESLVTTTNLVLGTDQVEKLNPKPVLPPDAPIAVILFAGGGGVEAGMVEAGIRPLTAVEFDPKKPKLSSAIADCHERNFGEYGCQVERKTVQEISKLGFPVFPRNTEFLHASPMCSNFSNAKAGEAIETTEDIEMASAVADAIRHLQPKFFTLENVKCYRDSQSFKIIVQALEVEGYIWQRQIMTLLDCQARERFIVWAAKGWLPPLPEPIQPVGWYEVVADLIPKMADSELVLGQQKSLEEFLSKNEPTPLLIQRTGAREKEYRIKPAHLPCDTILRSHFTDGKGCNRNKFADIWLPDGTVKSLSIEAAARLQGFPDWYEFPPDTATAGSIIGYSVPPKFAAQLFKSLQQPPPIEVQILQSLERIIQHNWHIQNLETESRQTNIIKEAIKSDKNAITSVQEHINQLLEELIIYRQLRELVGADEAKIRTLKIIATQNHNQSTSD